MEERDEENTQIQILRSRSRPQNCIMATIQKKALWFSTKCKNEFSTEFTKIIQCCTCPAISLDASHHCGAIKKSLLDENNTHKKSLLVVVFFGNGPKRAREWEENRISPKSVNFTFSHTISKVFSTDTEHQNTTKSLWIICKMSGCEVFAWEATFSLKNKQKQERKDALSSSGVRLELTVHVLLIPNRKRRFAPRKSPPIATTAPSFDWRQKFTTCFVYIFYANFRGIFGSICAN